MPKIHPKNERTKRAYLKFLEQAQRRSSASIRQTAMALADFEQATGGKDFAAFRVEQAEAYKRRLMEDARRPDGEPLAVATVNARLLALKAFFRWLAGRPGFSRITRDMGEYFSPSATACRTAGVSRPRPTPTIEQIRAVVSHAPSETDTEKRDRALIAFALVSGARDMAIATLKLKHVDVAQRLVFQDARDVATKFGKTIPSWFFPIGDDFADVVTAWIAHLRGALGFGDGDPLFPATKIGLDAEGGFVPVGLSREHWASAQPIRRIFAERFAAAGMPYFHPHSFRRTLALEGQRRCLTPEGLKAWSQNLGHEQVLTTFTSYGTVPPERQAAIMADMRDGGELLPAGMTRQDVMALAARLMRDGKG